MPELPRLTGALRAFGTVSCQDEAGPSNDLALRKSLLLKKQKDRSLSWDNLTLLIKKNATGASNSDISGVTKQLIATAKQIVGSEESAETVECGAAFLFDIFKSVESVGQREATQLRSTFGPYPATAATKACQLVRKLVGWLPEAALAQLSSQREEGDGAASNEEFGRSIKFSMSYNVEEEDKDDISSEEDELALEDNKKDFDLRYKAAAASAASLSAQAETRGHKSSLEYGSEWMKELISKYFEGNDTALSLGLTELSTTIYDVLSSQRSDNELQNEMFELLGFERFELIQQLLEKRDQIIKSWTAESTRALMRQMPKKKPENERPLYGCQVLVQSEEEKYLNKQQRKEEKRSRKDLKPSNEDQELAGALDISPEELRRTREAALRAAASAPLFSSRSAGYTRPEQYPHVFDKQAEAQRSPAYIAGTKLVLPDNFTRKDEKLYEEINIPHGSSAPANIGKDRVLISSLDKIGQAAFRNTKSLNLIQSVVFDAAYKTNENLLICAPTGAGKTNIAMLTILHEIRQHISHDVIKKDEFKIVYVAPMKALAAEMVRNFGGRLEALGITVRELTGDMSLTKQEILKTQMLVTTPEKWDVVTRKATGDVALAQLVRLLIIDEVHLLHDDRGPVIETLVARTKRQVESTQSMIRIVGLSATLPNYLDVATFLNVNPYLGLFVFDGRFRPVPLGQTFIGIKSTNKMNQLRDFNTVCYDKVLKQVQDGYQVMVFVHARNETVRTAFTLSELARNKGQAGVFTPEQSRGYGDAQKAMAKSRNKQLREMFVDGFGIHHAGMLRQDRNLVEKYFAEGHIKVLVCTATLAWGVNLPAHAVIIKGTQIYDAKKGQFVDLGILDVMQIFGRAGRPQFDSFGHGTIITTQDKLSHYLSLMTRQHPIESQFIHSLTDNLNAEISLGTVTNTEEAVRWMSYTYLFVRMRKNPLVYGIPHTFCQDDPQLEAHRTALVVEAARKLDKAKMIRFEEHTNYMFSTDLGRIASNFYIKHATVEVINEMMKAAMSEGDILDLVANAQEFEQIKVREDEMEELDRLTGDGCEMIVKGGKENTHGKVNILLQSYVSRISVDSFSLVSDMAYVAQNASRIMRALFEVALKNSKPLLASRLLEMCKMVEKRLWTFENPMRQFSVLSHEILSKLEARRLVPERMRDMTSKEIGEMVSHVKMGPLIKRLVHQIPQLTLDASIQPITRTVLRVRLDISPNFLWDDKVHGGTSEPFWIWVEDPENDHIYHSEYFLLHKKQVRSEEPQSIVFTIPIFEPLPTQYYVKAVSDRWIGSSTTQAISFKHLILPERHPPHTGQSLTHLYTHTETPSPNRSVSLTHLYIHREAPSPHRSVSQTPLNTDTLPTLTQIFHTIYHTDCNVLLGAPTGSGKTLAAELAIFRVFREYPKFKAVYIAPLKALVRERMDDWKIRIEQKLGKKVVELTGDVTPDMRAVANADLIVTTPEKWDGISRSWQTRSYVKAVALLVIDEIHLLGDDRGPVLEVIVSRTNFISSHTEKKVRVVGLSTALANARDLADWLGIKEMGLFNFRPSVRPVPLEVHVKGFPGQHYCPRMATMNKPCFQADLWASLLAIVLPVPSRSHGKFVSHFATNCEQMSEQFVSHCATKSQQISGQVCWLLCHQHPADLWTSLLAVVLQVPSRSQGKFAMVPPTPSRSQGKFAIVSLVPSRSQVKFFSHCATNTQQISGQVCHCATNSQQISGQADLWASLLAIVLPTASRLRASLPLCHQHPADLRASLFAMVPPTPSRSQGKFAIVSIVPSRSLAIKTHSPHKPVLIFVSSRRQTRLTALDLVAFLVAEDSAKQWLHMPEEDVSTGVHVAPAVVMLYVYYRNCLVFCIFLSTF
ncbi:activating signal cointegrator 1 complex subunit 3-like [Plakobranchus ocellatus]|uniref:U5 small nuclear ribonucleoprotein 200 kDa helicase n=1 Tax=Plakobranchus ocellatus TaxID=259542 RepID=A0AAV4AA95_9GAST|nr:activating signal cointegrator 1 complex subunit 3-like [Plakobranchus ocellatus]